MARSSATARSVRASPLGVGGQALATEICKRFYLDGDSKVQIAADLGVSRFRVARLLESARASGLVQIHVGAPAGIDTALAEEVAARFALRTAIVLSDQPEWGAPTLQNEAGPLGTAVGRVAADYMQETTSPDDVVGLAWGHAMSALCGAWSEHIPATFVQLAGAIARSDMPMSAPDLVRATAAAAGGTAAYYYAPIVMPEANSAEALRQQIGVRETFAQLEHLTRAVISIGAWAPGQSTVHDALEVEDQQAALHAGAVAETTGLLLSADGVVLDVLADRVVAVGEEHLRRTAQVIALAVGVERSGATAAVLRSGMVSTLITHSALARELVGEGAQ